MLLLVIFSVGSYGAFLRMLKDNKYAKDEAQETEWGVAGRKPESAKRMSVVIIGVDDVDGSSRSDTLMLVNIMPVAKSVSLLSIPRDTRVKFGSRHGFEKITHAHAYGGVKASISAVEALTGVPVDYYVKLDYDCFEHIVDSMGGVYIDVEKPMRYTDKAAGLVIDLEPGYQRLNGKAALSYVRFRSDSLGDIGRISRQDKFLRAVAKQIMKPTSFLRLPGIIRAVRRSLDTDMGLGQMLAIAKVFRSIDVESVEMSVLAGHPEYIGGVSYWIPNESELRAQVAHLFETGEKDSATIEVLNGSGIPGAARSLASTLEDTGFTVGRIDNAERMDYKRTLLIDQTGNSEAVARLFEVLDPGYIDYQMRLTPDAETDLVIVIGRDIRLLHRTEEVIVN